MFLWFFLSKVETSVTNSLLEAFKQLGALLSDKFSQIWKKVQGLESDFFSVVGLVEKVFAS